MIINKSVRQSNILDTKAYWVEFSDGTRLSILAFNEDSVRECCSQHMLYRNYPIKTIEVEEEAV